MSGRTGSGQGYQCVGGHARGGVEWREGVYAGVR